MSVIDRVPPLRGAVLGGAGVTPPLPRATEWLLEKTRKGLGRGREDPALAAASQGVPRPRG